MHCLNCGDTHRDSWEPFVEADPKTNKLLVNLLVKNITRNASRQIEATLFGVNGEVIKKTLNPSLRVDFFNRDATQVKVPQFYPSENGELAREVRVGCPCPCHHEWDAWNKKGLYQRQNRHVLVPFTGAILCNNEVHPLKGRQGPRHHADWEYADELNPRL